MLHPIHTLTMILQSAKLCFVDFPDKVYIATARLQAIRDDPDSTYTSVCTGITLHHVAFLCLGLLQH